MLWGQHFSELRNNYLLTVKLATSVILGCYVYWYTENMLIIKLWFLASGTLQQALAVTFLLLLLLQVF